MPGRGVGSGLQRSDQAVVNVPPMVRTDLLRRDAIALDGVDGSQGGFDFRPSGKAEQKLAPRRDAGDCGAWVLRANRPQYVDPAFDGAVVVRRPPHEREDRAGGKCDLLLRAGQDGFLGDPTETDPAFDAPFYPCEVDDCPHRLSAPAADRLAKWQRAAWQAGRGSRSRPRSKSSRPV